MLTHTAVRARNNRGTPVGRPKQPLLANYSGSLLEPLTAVSRKGRFRHTWRRIRLMYADSLSNRLLLIVLANGRLWDKLVVADFGCCS